MRKLLVVALLFALQAVSQVTTPTTKPVIASDFGRWSIPAVSPVGIGVGSVSLQFSIATSSSGPSFPPVSANTPLLIVDFGNSEVVIPSGVNCPMGGVTCSFTATFTKAHRGSFQVSSGTFGLQEAINYLLGNNAGTVQITSDWPGTTSTITSITSGGANVSLQDIRNGLTIYAWNGLAYVAVGSSSSSPGTSPTLPNCTAAGTAPNEGVQLSTQVVLGVTQLCGTLAAASSTSVVGVCASNCGTTGFPVVVYSGYTQAIFDNQTVQGDYVIPSTTPGWFDDIGSVRPPGTVEIVGIVASTNTGTGTIASLLVSPLSLFAPGSASGSGTVSNSTQSGCIPYYSAPGTVVVPDCSFKTDGAGNGILNSLTVAGAGTGVITLLSGAAPSNPSSGKGSVYLNSVTGLLSCLNSSGGNCISTTPPGAPTASVQFNNGSGGFSGNSNFLWDNTNKALTLGPTTNVGYLTLQSTPSLYSENTQTGLIGGTRGPFTLPYDFSSYLNPAADSAIELFNENALLAIQPTSTHDYTNELVGLHCEGDHNGSGTVATLFGCAAEAYNLGSGTVTHLTGLQSEVGSLLTTHNTIGTLEAFQAVLTFNNSTVTNAYGLHITAPVNVTSTVTNLNSLQIDDPTGGGSFPSAQAINITGSAPSNLGNGVASAGGFGFTCPTASAPSSGPALYCGVAAGTNRIVGSANGADFFLFNMTGAANTGKLNVGNLGGFTWSVGTANSLTSQTGITQDGPGSIDVGNGTQGDKTGTVNATLFTGPPTTSGANLGTFGSLTAPTYSFVNPNADTRYPRSGMLMQAGNALALSYDGTMVLGGFTTYTEILDANGFCWTAGIASNPDSCMWRTATGKYEFGNSNLANSKGALTASSYTSAGTKFTTNNGCTDAATAGGATAGTFTVGATTSCTEVITLGDSATAPTGWSCTAIDLTTLADVTNPHQTASSTTTVTIVTGTIVASDKIQFSCIGY